MDISRTQTIIAGTSFALLITAFRDDIPVPDVLPDEIPVEWFDNLDRYRMRVMLSTSQRGTRIVASTTTDAPLRIERRDSAHYLLNIPATATTCMDAGEIILTIEICDTQSDAVLKAERRTIPLVKARDIRP